MRRLILAAIILYALPARASEVYFGKYLASSYRAAPATVAPASYVAGVVVDREMLQGITPRVSIETLMDSTNNDGSFHPASVRYELGVRGELESGWYLDASRMCWHSIDGVGTESYWLIKGGVKW